MKGRLTVSTTVLGTGVVLAMLAGGYGWYELRLVQAHGQAQRRELAELSAMTVALKLDELLRGAEEQVEACRQRWGQERAGPVDMEKPGDVLFEVGDFVEMCRGEAEKAGIRCEPEMGFGFAGYVRAAAEVASDEMLRQQLADLRRIMAAVWAARPERLVGVRRPRLKGEVGGSEQNFLNEETKPTLEWPTGIQADTFQMEWLGDTAGLRRFLNTIVTGDGAIVVRSLAVRPAEGSAPQSAGRLHVSVELCCVQGRNIEIDRSVPAVIWGASWPTNLFAPPVRTAAVDKNESGLALVAMGVEPFRLQLSGYVGKPGQYRATLSAANDARSWVVAEGHRVSDLGLTVRSITVGRQTVKHADDWPVIEAMAKVTVWDEWTQAEVVLPAGRLATTGRHWVELRARSTGAKTQRCYEGDEVQCGTSIYRVERIRPDEGRVELRASPEREETAGQPLSLRVEET